MTKRICSLLLTLCLIFSLALLLLRQMANTRPLTISLKTGLIPNFPEMLRYQIPSSYVRIILAKLLAT